MWFLACNQHPPTSTPLWQSTSPQEVWDVRASDASWCHHREARHHSPERFHSPFLAGRMNFPPLSRMRSQWQFSSDTWKLISSVINWLHLKKNLSLTSPCLASICSEQCLELSITSTSCVCLPLYNISLIVFLNCKSVWIKVSAKWINQPGLITIRTSVHFVRHCFMYLTARFATLSRAMSTDWR